MTRTWDPTFVPQLRPLEAIPLSQDGSGSVALRDRTQLSQAVLSVSEGALAVLSLVDGQRTCHQICHEFAALSGWSLPVDTLQNVLDQLDSAHFLEGAAFNEYYDLLVEAYRSAPVREPIHTSELNSSEITALFGEMLAERLPWTPPGHLIEDQNNATEAPAGLIRGLVAPHLDYARGRPCYSAAYGALRSRPAPNRVVILGTNHFGRSSAVVATAKDFGTPLGTARTDVAFIQRIEARCGELRRHELDHAREHSVELQVAWLQFLFGTNSFSIVPLLCPDPCGPTGTAPYDGCGVDLRKFAESLGLLIRDDGQDTLLIAGADLSHVGISFGDDRLVDDGFLTEVRTGDERALAALQRNQPDELLRSVRRGENPTRICSAGCLFTLLTALPDATPTQLGYHQALDDERHTCVTCTAAVLR